MNRSSKAAAIVLALFSLPFCIFGLLAVATGIRQIMDGQSPQARMLVIFGLVFSTVGFGLLATLILGPKKLQQAQQRQAENPTQPWLWRDDWAQGRANGETKSELIRAWAFSILWNLISAPILFVIPREKLQQQPASLVALAFPLIGAALLVWAVRETLRWFEFGKTYFEMSSVPCVIGREVRGTIQTRFPRPPTHGIQLKLTCVNRVVTGSGNTQTTQEKILWREQKAVAPEDLSPGPVGTSIPVSFHLPADARSTDGTSPRNSIFWKLEADADVPGVDYKDLFELPVFHTQDSVSEEPESTPAAVAEAQPPVRPTIVMRPAAEGGTEFYFPAARNKSFAAGLTGFVTLWSGFLWLMIVKGAPFFFPLVFGLFDLLLIYGAIQLWLGTSSVVIGSRTVRVRSGLLGAGKTREIDFGDVVKLQTEIAAQQGGASGTPYYDIQLIRSDGTKVTVGKTIQDKHEAEYLAAEMQRLIAPQPHTMSAAAGR
jgi:hypothetical protein